MLNAVYKGLRGLLSGRDWVYLLSLLLPLAFYNLLLKAMATSAQGEVGGTLEALRLMRSDILFNLGYVLFWIGLFAAVRSGAPRKIVTVLFHVSALLVVIVTTCANQYFEATGSTLDFSVIVFYLTTLGEVKNIIASETPWYVWVLLCAVLLYVVLGPWTLTRAIFSRSESGYSHQPSGLTRLSAFGLCLISVSLGAMSLVPGVAGVNRAFSLSPPVNVLATGLGGPDTSVEIGDVDSLAAASLKDAELRRTTGTERRNVVMIHLESVRSRSITPYNEDIGTTPFLDKLADRSLLAERAYTTTPHTSKAITSLNCGIYPAPETGIVESEPGGVPVNCLPGMLERQGYNTVFFQAANEEFEDRPQLTQNFGYGKFHGLGEMDKTGYERAGYLGYEDAIMLPPSREWLSEHGGEKPFFASYVTITPHHEWLAPDDRYGSKDFGREDERLERYLNTVRYVDFFLKDLIQQYKDLGLYEDTVFIIYGDHGEGFAEHGVRGHDNVIHEEGLRIPLIIHDPQRWQDGERISPDSPVNLMDVPPTILDLLGYRTANGRYPGASILDRPENRTLYSNCRPDRLCMSSTRGYEKYIYHYGQKPSEFYNLRKDPLEQNNLAGRVGKKELDRRREDLLRWHEESAALFEESEEK